MSRHHLHDSARLAVEKEKGRRRKKPNLADVIGAGAGLRTLSAAVFHTRLIFNELREQDTFPGRQTLARMNAKNGFAGLCKLMYSAVVALPWYQLGIGGGHQDVRFHLAQHGLDQHSSAAGSSSGH